MDATARRRLIRAALLPSRRRMVNEVVRPANLAPCVVCGEDVAIRAGYEGDVLCILHFFSEDPTEDWERDDDQG